MGQKKIEVVNILLNVYFVCMYAFVERNAFSLSV